MRASEQEQTGGAGVSEVFAKFQRIGWGPILNQAHDLGTDLLVQARDHRRFDRGLIVGAQIKAGPSWFEDGERGPDGDLVGWWYYEPGTAHFDDWVMHRLPHVLVLHDLESNISYWVHVTADQVVSTGKGCKILVPAAQTIDGDHADDLLGVAAQQKAAPSVEGTAFHASAQAVSPGRRLRYSLIAPRLVAPHRNLGHSTPITPEEALALCIHGRFLDLQRFAEKHDAVPDPRQPYDGKDWKWSFVRATWTWALDDDLVGLEGATRSAPSSEARAASGVLFASALLRAERVSEALDLLNTLVEKDDLGPVDHGWVLVQRSRVRSEIGDVAGARADAVEAQRQFQGDADDLTASALAAAAAWQLFMTAGFGEGDLGDTLTASDTAVAWWRSQMISWALDEASERAFRNWAEDLSNRWFSEDSLTLNLFAAELNADLTGEHGTWRAVAALAARHRLMSAHEAGDGDEIATGLDALRRSGDDASLKLVVTHLRQAGPVHPVAEAVSRIRAEGWTHTTAKANLELLARAGDLLNSNDADKWVEMLVDLLAGDSSAFVGRVRPAFTVNLSVAEAISGLLPAASEGARRRVAEYLASQPGPIDDLLAHPVDRWIDEFDIGNLTTDIRDGLRRLGDADRGRVGAHILGWLADNDDNEAKLEVHARALAGDLHALSAMGDVTVLTSEQAESLVEKFDSMVRDTVEQAEKSAGGFGGFDGGRGLALFNIWFHDVARWDSLLELLTHPNVGSEDKRGALKLIVEVSDRVPVSVRHQLAEKIEAIAAVPAFEMVGSRAIGGLATAVGIVTGAIADDAADVAIARLALGGQQDRCDAAGLLGRGWCAHMRPLLASFVADSRSVVRVAAASAVGRLASSNPDSVVVELARLLADDDGTVVPSALLIGLSRGENGTQLGREVAERLIRHESARVRTLAQQFLNRLPGSPTT